MQESKPAPWHHHDFRAMGSHMSVWIETDDLKTATSAFDRVEALFAGYEQSLSRFRPDSDLSQLNAATGQWAVVSDLLWDVLSLALEMATVTDGRFDPTMLNALEHAGYTTTFEQLKPASEDQQQGPKLSCFGSWPAVAVDADRQAVFLPKGVRVDLGGIAKGFTAQRAVEQIRSYGPCLVDAGGDLAAGAGPEGYPGWPVAIASPWKSELENSFDLCQLWLENHALATSGIDYRVWEHRGRSQHHLMDPCTGMPANTDCVTVSVLAEDAAQAEAWATATLVAGSVAGSEALEAAKLAGLVVTEFGNVLVTPAMQWALQMLPEQQFGPR
jgi:thiamine biosynthesis lipoprotein